MFKALAVSALLCLSFSGAQACPMADQSYTVKINVHLTTKLYFNPDCGEVIQNYRGNITRHKVSPRGRGWTFLERNEKFSWYVSPSGKSIRFTGPEWHVTGRMVKNRKKTP